MAAAAFLSFSSLFFIDLSKIYYKCGILAAKKKGQAEKGKFVENQIDGCEQNRAKRKRCIFWSFCLSHSVSTVLHSFTFNINIFTCGDVSTIEYKRISLLENGCLRAIACHHRRYYIGIPQPVLFHFTWFLPLTNERTPLLFMPSWTESHRINLNIKWILFKIQCKYFHWGFSVRCRVYSVGCVSCQIEPSFSGTGGQRESSNKMIEEEEEEDETKIIIIK